MTDRSSTQLTRRQFLGAAASVTAWAGVGIRLPVGAVFAPAFFNCDAQFFAQLTAVLREKPDLCVTLFLTTAELQATQVKTGRQIDIGFRPNMPDVHSDYAKWLSHHPKPLFATVEQGALWSKLVTLCANEAILLASWDGISEELSAENPTPLLNGAAVHLESLFASIYKTDFLFRKSSERITPLHALV